MGASGTQAERNKTTLEDVGRRRPRDTSLLLLPAPLTKKFPTFSKYNFSYFLSLVQVIQFSTFPKKRGRSIISGPGALLVPAAAAALRDRRSIVLLERHEKR